MGNYDQPPGWRTVDNQWDKYEESEEDRMVELIIDLIYEGRLDLSELYESDPHVQALIDAEFEDWVFGKSFDDMDRAGYFEDFWETNDERLLEIVTENMDVYPMDMYGIYPEVKKAIDTDFDNWRYDQ